MDIISKAKDLAAKRDLAIEEAKKNIPLLKDLVCERLHSINEKTNNGKAVFNIMS